MNTSTNIREIEIDFDVLPTDNPKYLRIHDQSYWGMIEGKPSVIDIKTPGTDAYIRNVFKKSKIASFTSVSLNLNCPQSDCDDLELLDLPDGIYEIVLLGSPSTFKKEKFYLRTTKFDLKLDELRIDIYSNNCTACKNKKEALLEIEYLIAVAESATKQGIQCTAQEAFYAAQKLLYKTINCKDCEGN